MKRYIAAVAIFMAVLRPAGTSADPADPVDLGQIVVTASRMAQHDYKIASDVTVIMDDQIEESPAQTISEMLAQQPGVSVYDNGTPKTAVVDIRGFGDTATRNVLVLVNDRKINPVDISGPDLLEVPLESVERIEIIRGAGSVLYGDNAVGGVVNIITKEGSGKFSGKAGVTGGSYGSKGQDMEISGEHRHVSYYLYSKYDEAGGYRVNSDVLTKDFAARLGYRLTEKLKASLNASWHEDDYGLPGGLTQANLDRLGRRGTAYPDDFASTKDRSIQLTLDASPWPENITWGRFVLDVSYRNRDVYDSFNSFGAFNTKRSIDTTGITGKYIFNKQVWNRQVNFVTGLDYYDSGNDILGSETNVDDITISKKEIGGYGYLEMETLKNVFLNGGLRYTKARYDFDQRNVVVNESQTPHAWVYMGGLKYEYAPGSTVHVNMQETFRFLATDEWYSTANYPPFGITPGLNLDLKQQTGRQYEAGIKHDFNRTAQVHATAYVMDINDEIYFDPLTFANSNYDKTRRIGVEVGETADLSRWFLPKVFSKSEVFANDTYQRPTFIGGDNDGKRIPWTAAHQARAGFNLTWRDKYRLTFSGTYVGSRFVINDILNETPRAKPTTVFDMKVDADIGPAEVYFSINNIFNEKYFSYVSKSTSSRVYFPAPERSYWGGMRVKF